MTCTSLHPLSLVALALVACGPHLHGAVSADGRSSADIVSIVFLPPDSGVRLTDLVTGTARDLPQGPGQGGRPLQVAIAPDGSEVLFTAEGLPRLGTVGTQLYRYRTATGTTDYLFDEPGKHFVTIQSQSPDGDTLVFLVEYLRTPGMAIWNKQVRYVFSTGDLNTSPIPRIREVVVVPTDPGLPTATVDPALLDAGSSDPDGDPLTLRLDPPGPYPIGSTFVDLVVSDGIFTVSTYDLPPFQGRKGRIVVEDREAPVLDVRLRHPLLLPCDHALVDVGLRLSASDNSGAVTIECTVTQDEPVAGTGSGDLAPDAERRLDAAGSLTGLLLRAERDPRGDGRVYLVQVTARDAAGNASSSRRAVVVPRDLRPLPLLAVVLQGLRAVRAGTPLPYDSFLPAGDG